jgi:hypothetical protein
MLRWLFGDIASVFSPRVDRGAGKAPTRRGGRWLVGFGIFLTLFGGIGVIGETGSVLERQPATVIDTYTTRIRTSNGGGSDVQKVRLLLEDGDTKDIPQEPLYDAIGSRDDVRVSVDIDPDTNLIDAVYLEGHRYGTGRQSAAVVITILFTVFGVFLLLRGIGRLRRARLRERTAAGAQAPAAAESLSG